MPPCSQGHRVLLKFSMIQPGGSHLRRICCKTSADILSLAFVIACIQCVCSVKPYACDCHCDYLVSECERIVQ